MGRHWCLGVDLVRQRETVLECDRFRPLGGPYDLARVSVGEGLHRGNS